MRDFFDKAPPLYERGWVTIVPISYRSKIPPIKGWDSLFSRAATPEEVTRWRYRHGGSGVGLALGYIRVVALDLDWTDPPTARVAYGIVVDKLGATPLVRVGCWPKVMLFYAVGPDFKERTSRHPAFETHTSGTQVLLYGRHPKTGRDYSYPYRSPLDVGPDSLPLVNSPQLCAVRAALAQLPPPPPPEDEQASKRPSRRPEGFFHPNATGNSMDGPIASYIPFLRPLSEEDRLTLAALAIAEAQPSTRFEVMSAMVFTLVELGAEDDEVMSLMPVYLDHFKDDGETEIRKRTAHFKGGITWARKNLGPSRSQLLDDPLIRAMCIDD